MAEPNQRDSREVQRLALGAAIAAATPASLKSIEPTVRTYAQEARAAGLGISDLLIEVKAVLRANAGANLDIFTPKIVGWAVAGYFAEP